MDEIINLQKIYTNNKNKITSNNTFKHDTVIVK